MFSTWFPLRVFWFYTRESELNSQVINTSAKSYLFSNLGKASLNPSSGQKSPGATCGAVTLAIPFLLGFVCSFPFFSCLLLCCVLTSQSLATDSRVRHSSSFFPSSRFAETKAKSLGPRFFQMLCDSVYSLFPAPVPLPSGHICARGSHGIRGEVSTIQPVLPLIYFIPKQKTTDWNICLFSYDSSFL